MYNSKGASIDVMDISGQQQMGIVSRIVKIDLDENQKPINIAQSSVLTEVVNCPSGIIPRIKRLTDVVVVMVLK